MTNVLLYITDDQRSRPDGGGSTTMTPMTNLASEILAHGTNFPNNYVTTPLCDPSRCSIYSGLWAHDHGCVSNDSEGLWDQAFSIQRFLQDAGYFTGLIGKPTTSEGAVPLEHFDYQETTTQDGTEMTQLVAKVTEFMSLAGSDDWFLVVSTNVPHRPYNLTAPGGYTIPAFVLPESSAETSLSDKHPTVTTQASHYDPDLAEEDFLGQLNELAAFDDVIPDIHATIADLDATLVIYTSDNGYEWGEHRLKIKDWPYLESHHVPLIVRWPDGGVAEGVTDERLAANVDIAPTILDAVGITPDYPMPGLLLTDPVTRDWLYTEIPDPDFARYSRSYLSLTRHYIEWLDGWGVEDYDLITDPFEETASNEVDVEIQALLDGTPLPEESPVPNAADVTLRPALPCG